MFRVFCMAMKYGFIVTFHCVIIEPQSGVLCNMTDPSKTHHILKSRELSFTFNLFRRYPNVWKFSTAHGSDAAVLCAKIENDWTTETDFVEELDFAFKVSFLIFAAETMLERNLMRMARYAATVHPGGKAAVMMAYAVRDYRDSDVTQSSWRHSLGNGQLVPQLFMLTINRNQFRITCPWQWESMVTVGFHSQKTNDMRNVDVIMLHQGSFCVCEQPMRNGVTLLRCLSLAERIHRVIAVEL